MLQHKKIKNIDNLNAFKKAVERIKVLIQTKSKMQLDKIHIEDLECLKKLFEVKEQGAIPFHLVQIRNAFIEAGYTNEITLQEIHQEVYPFHFDNPKLTEYLANIWNEMFERQVQILIF